MYAIIETGGKQYKVKKGDTIDVELLPKEKGEDVEFDKVLLFSKDNKIEIGQPYLKGVKVLAKIIDNIKDDKVVCFKYRNKTNYKRKIGHRQRYSRVKIEEIES